MLAKTINVTDTFRVRVDTYGNYMPESWKESEKITFGKFKGEMSEPKWITYDRYYSNLAKAIRFGCEEGIVGSELVVSDTMSLEDYLKYLEGVYRKIEEVCQ